MPQPVRTLIRALHVEPQGYVENWEGTLNPRLRTRPVVTRITVEIDLLSDVSINNAQDARILLREALEAECLG